jgi:hypothetical protein
VKDKKQKSVKGAKKSTPATEIVEDATPTAKAVAKPKVEQKKKQEPVKGAKKSTPATEIVEDAAATAKVAAKPNVEEKKKRPRAVKGPLPLQVRRINAKRRPKPPSIKSRPPLSKVVSARKVMSTPSSLKPKQPLLTKLYSITSASALKHAQKMFVQLVKDHDILNEHGKQLAESGEGPFNVKADKVIKSRDATLHAGLLESYKTLEEALSKKKVATATGLPPLGEAKDTELGAISAQALKLKPIDKPQPPVPGVVCGLERVLFNPGVYHLRDPHSHVYNFDPYLESITPVKEFDYDALKEYITSSRDAALIGIASEEGTKYTGSTSSMTSALAHFHYLLSKWRPINLAQLSRGFPAPLESFSRMQRAPSGIFLRWKDGVYAIDANKEFDTANVLMWLGKSMEKFLTADKSEYEKYRKEHSHRLTDEEKTSPESYHYTTMGDFLMRSQLDAYDPRLPGTGMFDLKTRAVVSIRKDATEFEQGLGYEIRSRRGEWESYEREYYDLCRSAFMKYSLQARMGRMDGIFVAYHNIERIFGFQYLPIPSMDEAIHGTTDTTLGDAEFKISVALLNKILDRATERFPAQSLQIDFETRPTSLASHDNFMYVFIAPTTEEEIKNIQERNLEEIQEYERRVIGLKSREQTELMRAVVEEAAKEADHEDEVERLEAAFENPNIPGNAELIRTAAEKIKNGETVTEKAVETMLDAVALRLEEDGAEALDEVAGAAEQKEDAEASSEEAETAKVDADGNAIVKKATQAAKSPILVFKVSTRNFVNGHEVLRPENLKKSDKWEVKWALKEIKGSAARSNYDMSKNRKKMMQMRSNTIDDWFNQSYGRQIMEQIESGKKHRKTMNRLDKEFGIKVLEDLEFENFEALEGKQEVKEKLATALKEEQEAREEPEKKAKEVAGENRKGEDKAPQVMEELQGTPREEVKKGMMNVLQEEPREEIIGDFKEDIKTDVKEDVKEDIKPDVKEAVKQEKEEEKKPWWIL